jgi:hypothetical protein
MNTMRNTAFIHDFFGKTHYLCYYVSTSTTIAFPTVSIALVYRLIINQTCAILWREQVKFQWDDDEVRFVLDQHAELDFYSASSLKQTVRGRNAYIGIFPGGKSTI